MRVVRSSRSFRGALCFLARGAPSVSATGNVHNPPGDDQGASVVPASRPQRSAIPYHGHRSSAWLIGQRSSSHAPNPHLAGQVTYKVLPPYCRAKQTCALRR
jgi:hypothetical protein